LAAKTAKSMTIDGKRYIPIHEAAEFLGISIKALYDWNSMGKVNFGIRYLGRVYYEATALEAFRAELVTPIRVFNGRIQAY
jgi:predicted site-specific integrase-resolvase